VLFLFPKCPVGEMDRVHLLVQNRQSRFAYRFWSHIGYPRLWHVDNYSGNCNDANTWASQGYYYILPYFWGNPALVSVILLTLKM
jgi:hypothetical protein